ncbi:MAG TPA: serine hydrolase domain-containing protein [Asanoa sp.]|nr:serine hydrolase domain-containing protein [Asanoa sp.]
MNEFRGAALVTAPTGEPLEALTGGGVDLGARMQVASVSKVFAAAVTLTLVDRGVLSLRDPVPPWPGVTVHHLLSQTSGLGQFANMPSIDLKAGVVSRDLIRREPLLDPPGTRWRYSSPGFIMLGELVERAADRPYPELVKELLIEPLGLRDTAVGARPADATSGHHDGVPATEWDLAALTGTGDIWSTVGDLNRLAHGLDRAVLHRMRQRQVELPEPDDGLTHYGYGLYLGGGIALHSGDVPGFRSVLAFLPDGRTAAVLSNDETAAAPRDVLRELLQGSAA